MAGFFKKLFNRITGRPNEEAAPVVVEQVALPAPEPEVVDVVKPKKVAPKKPAPKKPEPKKVVAKKVEAKKPEPKKPVAKKVEAKKPAPKKPEPQKPEPRSKAKVVALPPSGEGAQQADDGLRATPILETERAERPSSGLSATFPQRGKDEDVRAVVPAFKPAVPVPAPVVEAPSRGGWFSRLKEGLTKTSKSIGGSITAIFTKKKLDKATLQDLEDTLIQADLGLPVAERIIAAVSHGRYDKEIDPEEVKQILASEVAKVLKPVEVPFNFGSEKPFVIAVVGVNGSGKTTTIGKLGSIAAGEGFKVKFAAGDTFRAAAIEQLTVWGNRIGAQTISRPQGADSAGLAFDALKEAQEDGTDILFIDTAGRLQNKAYLMDELDKMVRVIKKIDASAPHAVLLVLDATTGQNALAQAEIFTKVAGVTGLIMTKLDGTARGGILVAIAEKFKLPIHAIGVGEKIEDLQPFDAEAFSRAIAGLDEK